MSLWNLPKSSSKRLQTRPWSLRGDSEDPVVEEVPGVYMTHTDRRSVTVRLARSFDRSYSSVRTEKAGSRSSRRVVAGEDRVELLWRRRL